MNDAWPAVIAEALTKGCETSGGAVPGAKLRQLVAQFAPRHGLKYPPPGDEAEKFGDFLKRFESTLIVLRRPGRDILVAPAEMPQLLDVSEKGSTQIREDMFDAFTRIPRGSPPLTAWYSRETDTVLWFREDAPPDSATFVKIPPATVQEQLEDRRLFAESSDVENDSKQALLGSLGGDTALGSFSNAVRAHGLARKWHLYRFRAVTKRIKDWSEREGVPWHDQWLYASEQRVLARPARAGTRAFGKGTRFGQFIDALSEEELRRISVPLDIVLKFLVG